MKKVHVFASIAAFLAGTVFGSGGFWEWQKIKIDRIVQTANLLDKENEEYAKIIDLSNEYISVAAQYEKAPNAELKSQLANKMDQLRARLAGRKDNFKDLENQLATLEGRQPRDIRLEFIPPAPPRLSGVVQ